MPSDRTIEAVRVMLRFADRTGLTSSRPARRYLWTDAFAVCNFLGLAQDTGDSHLAELALQLIGQVHHELGRHRYDDPERAGWISGLSEAEGEAHPTRGGLRIGKPLPERAANEPIDQTLEWDRDGQYFHYLTKWMHALDQTARWTRAPKLNAWARELADAAHRAFTYGPPGNKRMRWKLSVDLSRPLVASMGHHDPLDGWVTCTELEATAAALPSAQGPSLARATSDFAEMTDFDGLATDDPLGLGGLMVDACRLAQLGADRERIAALLSASAVGLRHYLAASDLRRPAQLRLAFRELGLAIGLAAVAMLEGDALATRLDASGRASVADLKEHLPIRAEIESFWRRPSHRGTSTWVMHADINDVMLATSLAPNGFLVLASPEQPSAALCSAPAAP